MLLLFTYAETIDWTYVQVDKTISWFHDFELIDCQVAQTTIDRVVERVGADCAGIINQRLCQLISHDREVLMFRGAVGRFLRRVIKLAREKEDWQNGPSIIELSKSLKLNSWVELEMVLSEVREIRNDLFYGEFVWLKSAWRDVCEHWKDLMDKPGHSPYINLDLHPIFNAHGMSVVTGINFDDIDDDVSLMTQDDVNIDFDPEPEAFNEQEVIDVDAPEVIEIVDTDDELTL